jgi:RNA polymerase sigma-32 factor
MNDVMAVPSGRQSSDEHLSRYMRQMRKFPMLDRETELDLIKRAQDDGDVKAMEQLIGSHQRLVIKIAADYRRYGVPMGDLISEGNIGLIQGIKKFDPDRGFRLSTYARWWIRTAIGDYILRSSSVVRTITNEHRKKLFFNLARLKKKHYGNEDGLLSPEAVTSISEELRVPEAETVRMDQWFSSRDQSTNTLVGEDGGTTWQDLLVDDSQDQESSLIERDQMDKRRALMSTALAELSDRERHILTERKLSDHPPPLSELSKVYGISRERVRQIETRALEKLRGLMRGAAMAQPAMG